MAKMVNCPIELALHKAEGGAEQWVHLIPAGTFEGRDGRGPYHLTSPEAVVRASLAHAGSIDIPIDYDHQIDHAERNGQPGVAAGWIKELKARPDGVWGRAEWTVKAAQRLEAKEFRYLSPVFTTTGDGTIVRLLRAALTNNPNLGQLKALASSEAPMELFARLRKLLSLPDEADDDAIFAKIEALSKTKHSAKPDPSKWVPFEEFQKVVAKCNELNLGVSTAAAANHVANAIREGKLIGSLRDWAIDLCTVNMPAFEAFLERTEKNTQSLIGRLPHFRDERNLPYRARIGETEQTVMQRMGLSDEDWAKGNTKIETGRDRS